MEDIIASDVKPKAESTVERVPLAEHMIEKIDIRMIERGFLNPMNDAQVDAAIIAKKLNEVIDHLNATRYTALVNSQLTAIGDQKQTTNN